MSDLGPFIFTYTGKRFYFKNPDPSMVCLEDIAHSLSNICRYTGHGHYYSVAEHSVRVLRWYEEHYPKAPLPERRCVLLHDATEAYVGDMSKPLKTLLPEYDDIEERVWRVVQNRFGLPDITPEIKLGDLTLLSSELPIVLNYHETRGGAMDWLPPRWEHANISLWDPATAERVFLEYADMLGIE